MDKIKSYIEQFFSKTKRNIRHSLRSDEMCVFIDKIVDLRGPDEAFDVTSTIYDYGYARGYRAAASKIKKGRKVYE